jgi:hypothetical protein
MEQRTKNMFVSIDAEKAFDKNQGAFMVKTQQIRYSRNVPQCYKGVTIPPPTHSVVKW